MYKNTIMLMPDKPNYPLQPVWIGQSSAALFRLINVPKISGLVVRLAIQPLAIAEEEPPTPIYFDGTFDYLSGVATVYVPGWNFPTVGQTGYNVAMLDAPTAEADATGDPHGYWVGCGQLNIMPAITTALLPNPPPIVLPDTYLRNPITGLYHLLSAELNPIGEIVTSLDPTGVTL